MGSFSKSPMGRMDSLNLFPRLLGSEFEFKFAGSLGVGDKGPKGVAGAL